MAPLPIDVVSDVVCPWCYVGKRYLEQAIALKPEIPVAVRFRPYLLNPWVPREGMSREDYLTTKFGSVDRYNANSQRIIDIAAKAGLDYARDKIKRQPNTIDCHRLIHWASEIGEARPLSISTTRNPVLPITSPILILVIRRGSYSTATFP